MRALGWLMVCLLGCAKVEVTPTDAGGDAGSELVVPKVVSVTDLGLIENPNGKNFGRDGTSSCALGGKLFYTFGDTLFFKKATDGASYRTNTGAYAAFDAATTLSEPLDDAGLPSQLIGFLPDEVAYNVDAGNSGGNRIALWPGRCVTRADGTAVVFYDKLKIQSGFNFESMGSAVVAPGATTATRVPDVLFTAPEPDFFHAAVVKDTDLYLFSCATLGMCAVARAPLAQATTRASYTFWDGARWSAKLSDAVFIVPGSSAGFSVSFNAYLGAWVSISSNAIGPEIKLRVAPDLLGPWSAAITIYSFPSAIYGATQHPALDELNGQRIYVSAFRDLGNFRGEIRLLRVDLARGAL